MPVCQGLYLVLVYLNQMIYTIVCQNQKIACQLEVQVGENMRMFSPIHFSFFEV